MKRIMLHSIEGILVDPNVSNHTCGEYVIGGSLRILCKTCIQVVG